MSRETQVGIYSIGLYLPEQVRTNAWWPASVVEQWRERIVTQRALREQGGGKCPEGLEHVFAAMAEHEDDPFKGSVERRVKPEGMLTSDMEAAAGRDAIARAGIDPAEIGLLLSSSQIPDYVNVQTAPRVHKELGLSEACMSAGVDTACNSFLTQLALAEQMVRGGAAKYALLVQSGGLQHLARIEDPHSAWFGDGATAVVVGPVSEGNGVLGRAHRTDGNLYRALVAGHPACRSSKESESALHVDDRPAAVRMITQAANMAKVVMDAALLEAGVDRREIAFYAAHQGTPWMRRLSQEAVGMPQARFVDTYRWTASVGPANIPLQMAMAEREDILHDGDLVAMYSGGSGVTWSGMVMRWGRGGRIN